MEIQSSNFQNQKKSKQQKYIQEIKAIWRAKISQSLRKNILINHICNIQDAFFINQKSLRDPEHEQQSFLTTIFYFKCVSKIDVSQNFITLHLKKRYQNYLPKQYFIERFKSFGNKQFYDIAVHLEHIAQHLSQIKSLPASQQFMEIYSKQYQQKILQQSLQKLQKKKFFSFFYQFTQQGSSLNQIIISKALLNALQYDYQDIAIDFLKYQQAIFEIISAKLYFLVMQKKSQIVDSIFSRMKQKILSSQEVKKLTMFRFNDDLISNSNSNTNDQFKRRIRSRIKFIKTHPSVTIFQIQKMNRHSKVQFQPFKKQQIQLNEYKKKIKKQEYQCIKNILKISQNCLEQNKQKISTYKQINPQNQTNIKKNKRKKRIISSSSDSQYLGFA